MSDEILAKYDFLPWYREGIALGVQKEDNLGSGPSDAPERAQVSVGVEMLENGQRLADGESDLTRVIDLYGPGDITGVDQRAITRVSPVPNTCDFKPNYFPLVEFDSPDFPWRFTPAKAKEGTKLRPWLCLAVLEETAEFDEKESPSGMLPRILVKSAAYLPDLSQSWAWAHVQVTRNGEETDLAGIIRADPERASARILAPRKLKENTSYHAFLVPAFETGRLAGLGLEPSGDGLLPAWNVGGGAVELPVYFRWKFRTSSKGDFEYLVRLLKPRRMSDKVGSRDIDVALPGYGIETREGVAGLEGALRPPGYVSRAWSGEDFRAAVKDILNTPAEVEESGEREKIIAPPIYCGWHIGKKKVSGVPGSWLETLNLHPMHRSTAGFGAAVVKENQEQLMASAWKQIGPIEEANRMRREGQLAREVSVRILERHLEPLSPGALLNITAPLHPRVPTADGSTVAANVEESPVPQGAFLPVFRRITRGRGPFHQRWAPQDKKVSVDFVDGFNSGGISCAPPAKGSDDVATVSGNSDNLYPGWVPVWLRPYLKYIVKILIGAGLILYLLNLLLNALGFGLAPDNPIIVGAALLFFIAGWLMRSMAACWRAADQAQDENFTLQSLEDLPPRTDFSFQAPGGAARPSSAGASESEDAAGFRLALTTLFETINTELPKKPDPKPLDLAGLRAELLAALDPNVTVATEIDNRASLAPEVAVWASDNLEPVMAHPKFPQPMYEPLRDISKKLLMPGLEFVPANTISLLETNQRFIEAYMAGLNHEMSRELLWREFPTDQRGTYFSQFWDVSAYVPFLTAGQTPEDLEDINPIHEWGRKELGHNKKPGPTADPSGANIVLLIRGDLLRQYPSAYIYAHKAKWNGRVRVLDEAAQPSIKVPIFRGTIEPDVTFIGFDLNKDSARGAGSNDEDNAPDTDAGWFFFIQEQPGEPRFGLDESDTAGPPSNDTTWNNFSWGNLAADNAGIALLNYVNISTPRALIEKFHPDPNEVSEAQAALIEWGKDSASMSYITLQRPMRVAIHATDMLPLDMF